MDGAAAPAPPPSRPITSREMQRLAARLGVPVGLSEDAAFGPIAPPEGARWEVGRGGAVLAAGAPQITGPASFKISGRHNCVLLDHAARIEGTGFILQGERCSVLVGPGCRLRKGTVKVAGSDCHVVFGAGTTWESGSIICSPKGMVILLGEDCMLSNGIMIRTDDSHAIFDRESGARVNAPQPVVIEPHVWIGNGARVNKGTRIGTGTVLGGLSVASRVLAPHAVYAGVPARRLRSGIVWSRSDALEDVPETYR